MQSTVYSGDKQPSGLLLRNGNTLEKLIFFLLCELNQLHLSGTRISSDVSLGYEIEFGKLNSQYCLISFFYKRVSCNNPGCLSDGRPKIVCLYKSVLVCQTELANLMRAEHSSVLTLGFVLCFLGLDCSPLGQKHNFTHSV